jgi:hypothetical protein
MARSRWKSLWSLKPPSCRRPHIPAAECPGIRMRFDSHARGRIVESA